MSWQQFTILVGAHFLALLSPGPDFFLLLNHSLIHGRRAGYRTALGIACANGTFIAAALCGVTWLQTNQHAYWAMYWCGCVYLTWLGWQFINATPLKIKTNSPSASKSNSSFFARGFASGIMNPKNALFYLTLFTVLSDKENSEIGRILAGVWMFFAVLIWDCIVCWTITQPRILSAFSIRQTLINRASAMMLFCIAGGMVLSYV